MTDERTLERTARSWIEAGPTHAPERAVEAALLRIETTTQERDLRIPRRITVNPIARLAGAAIAGILVVGSFILMARPGSNIGTQTPPPTQGSPSPSLASPSGSPVLDATFTSARHGVTISYPTGWTVRPATVTTASISEATGVLEAYDMVSSDDARFIVVSGRLPKGQSFDQYLAQQDAAFADAGPAGCHFAAANRQRVRVDLVAATLTDSDCVALGPFKPDHWSRAVVARGDVVYVFQLDSATPTRLLFEAFLGEVTFDTP